MTHLLASLPAPPFQDLQLGPLNFRLYGLCIALGALAGVAIMRRRWQAMGGDPEDMTTIALVAIPAGLIGTRIYHVVTDWSRLYSGGRWWPDAFLIWKGGLGIPGGIVLGTLAGVLVARRLKVDVALGFDAAAPAVPLAQAIGRIGNYFNQELFGRPTNLPWPFSQAILFLRNSVSMPFVIFVTIASLRASIFATSIFAPVTVTPWSPRPVSACSYCSEDSSSALDGMQPTFRQVPPSLLSPCGSRHSSTQAVARPSWAARIAEM